MIPSSRTANLFGELVAEYLRQVLSPPDINADPWETVLQQLWNAIEQSPGLEWSQKSMSKQLGISTATWQRLVRRLFNSTPQRFSSGCGGQ